MPDAEEFSVARIGLGGFAASLRSGRTTVLTECSAMLERIGRSDAGAFIATEREPALRAACALDHLLASGTDLGPLMGVTVALKDLFALTGTATRAGSPIDLDDLPASDGSFVRRLKRAGAVIVGKTFTTEFALGQLNLERDIPRNPADPATPRVPGGSSSGSAVAQAAGLAGIAIGTDTGGSVRAPAAYCGVVGIRPGAGWAATDGVWPLSPALDGIGWFAHRMSDAALTWSVLAEAPLPIAIELNGLHAGLPRDWLEGALDPPVQERFEAALARLARAGVRFRDITVPEAQPSVAYFSEIVPTEVAVSLGPDRLARYWDRFDPLTRLRLEACAGTTARDYAGQERRRLEVQRRVPARFEDLDAWLTPTTPDTAPPLASLSTLQQAGPWLARATRFTRPVNYLGLASLSLPLPGPAGALPVGLQIAAPAGAENRLLGLGLAIEAALADLSA